MSLELGRSVIRRRGAPGARRSSASGVFDELTARRERPGRTTGRGSLGATPFMSRSLPVAERPRRPEWMKVRAPSRDTRYFEVRELIHGAEPAHDLRGGPLPEHRRVLGPRHGHVPDPRRDLHAGVPLLLRQLGTSRASARPARAAPSRADGEADGALPRRRHVGRSRRPARPGRRPLRGHDPRAQGEACPRHRSRC